MNPRIGLNPRSLRKMDGNRSSIGSPDSSKPSDLPVGDELAQAQPAGDDTDDDIYVYASLLYDPALVHSPENTKASFNRPCPFYLLEHQWTRLGVANWSKSHSPNSHGSPSHFLHGLMCAVRAYQRSHRDLSQSICLRVRVHSHCSGKITTHITIPAPRPALSAMFPQTFGVPAYLPKTEWTIVLDTQPTEVAESTMYKTSDRSPYARARASAAVSEPWRLKREVLLYNTDGEMLDATSSTPYFFRNGRWVVPTSASGGLQGTTRRWALEHGVAHEGVVTKDSLKIGEFVCLSNGFWGFFYARLVAQDPRLIPPTEDECRRIEMLMRG